MKPQPPAELTERQETEQTRHQKLLRAAPAFPYQEDDKYCGSEGISTHLYVATHLLAGLLSKHSDDPNISPVNDELIAEAIKLSSILIEKCD